MSKILDKVLKTNLYLLIFLVPIFFLPFTFEIFEFNKIYLLFFFVSITFILWLFKMVAFDKEVKFKKAALDLPVIIFLAVAVLSAIFSVDRISSVFGFYGRFSDGLILVLTLGLMYFLITNIAEEEKKETKNSGKPFNMQFALNILICSAFICLVFGFLAAFGILENIKSLPIEMKFRLFNPVSNSLDGLVVFLSIMIALSVGKILSGNEKRPFLFLNWVFLALALLFLIFFDSNISWLIILFSSVVFLGLSLSKRMFKKDINKLILPISLVILSALFFIINTSQIQNTILGGQLEKEVVLNQKFSNQIALWGATVDIKSFFVGSGIGTWHYDFSKFKPLDFNNTIYWERRFDRAGSYLSEIVGTMGFLGLLSYLFLIGTFFSISYWLFQQGSNSSTLLIIFLALLVSQFVYYENTVLLFLFWLMISFAAVSGKEKAQVKTINFKSFPEMFLIFFSLLIVLSLAVLVLYYFGVKFYLADLNYREALEKNDIEKMTKAVALNPYQSQYVVNLSRSYLSRVVDEFNKPLVEGESNEAISNYIQMALNYAKGGKTEDVNITGAVQMAPNRVAAWETAGMIYREISSYVSGSAEWGIKAFEEAIKLEPTNPVLRIELAKMYMLSDKMDEAKNELYKAKELKPDFYDSTIIMALILEQEKNLADAIKLLEEVEIPTAEVLYQKGRLYFNNQETDKAIGIFEALVAQIPNYSDARYSLALAYQRKGEKAKAIAELEKVLEINPGNADIQAKLDELKK